MEGISGRLTGGGAGAHLNTAGTAAGVAGDGRGPTLQDLMDGSSFRLSRRSEGQLGGRFSGGVWTAWGQGVRTGFEGAEHDLTVDGRVLTAMAGVDYEVGRYLAGVAVARSAGSGTLNMLASGAARERTEEVESELTGVYPYLRVNVNERVFAWGLAGHGRGEMSFPSVGRPSETDIRLNMGAFGVRGVLLDPGSSRIGLALKSDVFMVGMDTEAQLGTISVAAGASRLRLLLEASERHELGAGEILVSTAEMGLRRDGGDADVGTGVDVGAGSRYVNEAYGLSAEGTIRWLMVHHATGFSEWGVGASVLYEPGGAERGLSVRLGSSWGMSTGSAVDLWAPHAAAKMAAAGGSGAGVGNGNAGALTAQVRYALSPLPSLFRGPRITADRAGRAAHKFEVTGSREPFPATVLPEPRRRPRELVRHGSSVHNWLPFDGHPHPVPVTGACSVAVWGEEEDHGTLSLAIVRWQSDFALCIWFGGILRTPPA